MKKAVVALFLLLGFQSFSQTWGNNLDDAKKEAAAQNKTILLVFSGSDWCGPCIKLDKTVWQSEEFKKEAAKHWVLVKADFPKKKANQLSEALTASNEALAEQYNKNGNFPLVLILDKTGKILGITAYKDVDAEQYIDSLLALEKK